MSNGFGRFFEAIKEMLNEARCCVLNHLANKFVWRGEAGGESEVCLSDVCRTQLEIAFEGNGRTAHVCLAMPL